MRICAVVGFSESGKTRLVTRLIEEFKRRGLRTCAVKRCSHGFSLDLEGKDSADFSRAGADGVALLAPEGWAAMGKSSVGDIRAWAGCLFPEADVVLVEGGKESRGFPKVEVLRAGVSETLMSDPAELVAVVSDVPLPEIPAVPVVRPSDPLRICDLILSLEEVP